MGDRAASTIDFLLQVGGKGKGIIFDTELRSKIVAEIDTETRGRGDAEKMNMLRMNATWYDQEGNRE